MVNKDDQSSLTLKHVIAAAMRDTYAAQTLSHALTEPKVVENPHLRSITEHLAEYVDEYEQVPKPGDWKTWKDSLPKERRQHITRLLSELFNVNLKGYTPEYLADTAFDLLREEAANNWVEDFMGRDRVTPNALQEAAETMDRLVPATLDGMVDLRDFRGNVELETREGGVPTGIPSLDDRISGWQDELVFILGDTGSGKSVACINHSYHAAIAGGNVLYLTLELDAEMVRHRFYRLVSERDRSEYAAERAGVLEALSNFWGRVQGNVRVIRRPTNVVTVSKLDRMIELHERQFGSLDMLVVDYAELMRPEQSDTSLQRHEQLARISHGLRDIAQEREFPVLSPLQAVRPQSKARQTHEYLTLAKAAKSYDMARAADIVIGHVRTPEEQEAKQSHYQLLKVRDAPGLRAKIPLYCDFDVMMIADLDDPDTRRTMEMRGGSETDPVVYREDDEDV